MAECPEAPLRGGELSFGTVFGTIASVQATEDSAWISNPTEAGAVDVDVFPSLRTIPVAAAVVVSSMAGADAVAKVSPILPWAPAVEEGKQFFLWLE